MGVQHGGRRWAAIALVTTLAGVLLGVLGPFGSYSGQGPAIRIAYWIGATWLGLFVYGGTLALIGPRLPQDPPLRWLILGLAIALASIPQAFATRAAAIMVWPDLAARAPAPLVWYGQVLAIALVIFLVLPGPRRWLQPSPTSQSNAAINPGSAAESWPDDVIALQMEDHYVRVHRPGGSTLVLMTMRAAIARAAAIEGLQTHRSWWVARGAVRSVEGDSRALRLIMSSGLVVPVARSQVAVLRQSGWI